MLALPQRKQCICLFLHAVWSCIGCKKRYEDKIRKADGIQEKLNEFLMERAPGLLKEFLDKPEIKHTWNEVVTEDLTSNNDEVIKFIL